MIIDLPFGDGVDAPSRMLSFGLQRSVFPLRRLSGVTQRTSFASRLWTCQIELPPQQGESLAAWSLFFDQITDPANRFALTPPHYSGPGTGYAGANPLVNGALQLGQNLSVDGLLPSATVLLKGDFLSWLVTSAKGNTNRELNRATADVNSNATGQAVIPLLIPIRQPTTDNAAVEIFRPTALFAPDESVSAVNFDLNLMSGFTFIATEDVWP